MLLNYSLLIVVAIIFYLDFSVPLRTFTD